MIKSIYSVYDKVSGVYGPVMCVNTEIEAVRVVVEATTGSQETNLSRYPDDFELVLLGIYDDHEGMVSSLETDVKKRVVGNMTQLVERMAPKLRRERVDKVLGEE